MAARGDRLFILKGMLKIDIIAIMLQQSEFHFTPSDVEHNV